MTMVAHHRTALALALTLSLAVTGCRPAFEASTTAAITALERGTPESVGMSSERLTRLHDAMPSLVDAGRRE